MPERIHMQPLAYGIPDAALRAAITLLSAALRTQSAPWSSGPRRRQSRPRWGSWVVFRPPRAQREKGPRQTELGLCGKSALKRANNHPYPCYTRRDLASRIRAGGPNRRDGMASPLSVDHCRPTRERHASRSGSEWRGVAGPRLRCRSRAQSRSGLRGPAALRPACSGLVGGWRKPAPSGVAGTLMPWARAGRR